MRLTRTMKAIVALAAVVLCSPAFAQWDLNWYVDLPGGPILDSLGANLASGNPVYMMWAGADGIVDGLDMNGNILGDDAVIILEGGGLASAVIGQTDWPWNPQDDGEYNQTSQMQDWYAGENLYAIAFDTGVVYSSGRFYGQGNYGISTATHIGTGLDGDTWDVWDGSWQTNQTLVPEPTTVALMIAGLGGVMAYRRKRSK